MHDTRRARFRLGVFLLSVAFAGAVVAAATGLSVQVKEAALRDKPSFLGKVLGELKYGEGVGVLEEAGGWSKVESGKGAGWLHGSALTQAKIVFTAGERDVEEKAGGREVALAGKGFGPALESEYRKKNPSLDFARIDKLEKIEVEPAVVASFLEKGRLKGF